MYVLSLAFLFVLLPKSVFAYLDPSAGSYIVQLIFAFFFSLLFFARAFLFKINSFLVRLPDYFKRCLQGGDKKL